MDALFASGRIVDLILALVLGEALLLAWLCRRLGRGLSLPALIANLAAGAGLMLALRAALTGAGWTIVAAWLLAGLAAHLADLGLRLRPPGAGRIAAAGPDPEQATLPPRSRAAST